MIILDTHIWVWWVYNDAQLTTQHHQTIQRYENIGLGVSIISCWEVAKLVEKGRLVLHCSVGEWIETALNYPGIRLLELTPEIVIASTQLPGNFHKDPADQMIVATARAYNAPLITVDEKILAYSHVETLS